MNPSSITINVHRFHEFVALALMPNNDDTTNTATIYLSTKTAKKVAKTLRQVANDISKTDFIEPHVTPTNIEVQP